MAVFTFGSTKKTLYNCELVNVLLKTKEEEMEMCLLTTPTICEPLTAQPISVCADSYEHLSELELADSSDGNTPLEIDLLIGSDYYWQLTTGRVSRGDDGPVAVETKLGWVLSGPVPTADCSLLTTHALRIDSHEEQSLNETLRSFWELESLGISGTCQSVHEEFEENISFKDGCYEVCLPWKKPRHILPDNYEISQKRLQGLLRRLRLTPNILQEYDSVIHKQLELGIVQPVSDMDLGVVGEVHYLPHHAVVKQDRETTKVRVVYDASAKATGGLSLNQCLHTGPSFNQKILDILLRFRSYPVALMADIEKAFLMVSVTEDDRNSLRFLWVDDITKSEPVIQTYRFSRVVFGVSSSPFLLNATIDYHLKQFSSTHPDLVKLIRQSIYVDDMVTGTMNIDEAQKLYSESKNIFKLGGFNLRKFFTNVPELQKLFNAEEQQPAAMSGSIEETYAKSTLGGVQAMTSTDQKVLGVKWNVSADCIVFSVQEIADVAEKEEPTKRRVTSIVGKFYDPLGFLSPVIIKFKVFFKELCEDCIEWDEELSGDILQKWQSLIKSLKEAPTFSIPRFYLQDIDIEGATLSLHGFCDASKEAYAAVVYIVAHSDSQVCVRFVVSKTRVAPRQELTIPRLELMSALLLARLIDNVMKSLSPIFCLEQPTCYTDSQVALYWIIGVSKDWKQFVQNRVLEIRELVPINCWKHCPGCENPADLPSRGLSPIELSVNSLWHCGPDWLKVPRDANLADMEMPTDCLAEMKTNNRMAHSLLTGTTTIYMESIIPCKNFSSFDRLILVTVYAKRFVNNLKRALKDNCSTDVSISPYPQELLEAERMWIQEAQRQIVNDRNFPMWRKQLGLYIDHDEVWRCGGRIQHAELPSSTKHPIILPRDHHLTKLIVGRAHEKVCHNGTKETLMEVIGSLKEDHW